MNISLLPDEFLNQMKLLLGEEFDDYIKSYELAPSAGLRINLQKVDPASFYSSISAIKEQVPWCPNGFYYDSNEKLAKDPYYFAGLYYLQEPSAMAPASFLPISPGDRVLDLCAAPGGKSTQLGMRLEGKGLLFSNDISNSRAKGLLKNLEIWGIPNICVSSEEPKKLALVFPEFFDKILVDAPCSGEGMFRKDSNMIKSYLEHGPSYYGPIQKEIISYAASMLKPGGVLLYSTCTFSPLENEEVIQSLLKEQEDMRLIPLDCSMGGVKSSIQEECIRFFPHKVDGEGHFLALLQKMGKSDNRICEGKPTTSSLPKELLDFLARIQIEFHHARIFIKNERVYYLPEDFIHHTSLRYLRTGLLLGELKKGRFEPSQALAMYLKPEQFDSVLFLSKEDERVIRYLKGETIFLKEDEFLEKGWGLVCVDGFSLGFVKGVGNTLKNKYYPGWRWQS